MGCVHVKMKLKEKNKSEVFLLQTLPVDPTDQVMLRLKLLDALMDMSKFLLAFR